MGLNSAGFNELEELDEKLENVRSAVAVGVRALRDLGSVEEIDVDACDNAVAAAEGANLGLYYFDELKSTSLKKPQIKVNLLASDESTQANWNLGTTLANGQNLCRSLMENPANIMTPTNFARIAVDTLSKLYVHFYLNYYFN